MRRLILRIAFIAALLSAAASEVVAQEAPNNEEIFEQVINSSSPYYYPALMLRYSTGDETLTATDYYYLYYGYAFSDDYRPFATIPAEVRVLSVFERAQENPTYDDMLEIIRHATEAMKQDPFSPSNLNFLVYAYGAVGDTLNEQINYNRMNNVLSTIKASGTGLTEKSPMHVLRFAHATDVLASLSLTVTKRLVVSRSTEYISVADAEGRAKSKGYYFDYSRIYWNKPDEAPRVERKWKINDYPIGGFK